MKVTTIWKAYFSPTGTTMRTVETIGQQLTYLLEAPSRTFDYTLPQKRQEEPIFQKQELVIFGVPVYAGRVPNVLLKFLDTIDGDGALALPVVLYGNRNYDDALIELKDILEKSGMKTIAAGAFVGEHSFSEILAAGRPDREDQQTMRSFAAKVAKKIKEVSIVKDIPAVKVSGTPYPYSGYYQPRDRKGNPVDIRKVKPLTKDSCIDCKLCAKICPMGSIDYEDVRAYIGICIKCGACIKRCPVNAKYYEDAAYLYHKEELEEGFKRRGSVELFL